MAQANPNTAAQVQKAILNVVLYPRGSRSCTDMFRNVIESPRMLKETRQLFQTAAALMDDHFFNSVKHYFDEKPPFQLENLIISGSASEGMQKTNFETNSISDCDFILVLKNITVTENDQKQGYLTVRENTPFVNLFLADEDLINTWADFLEKSDQEQHKRIASLSSMKLKQRFEENYISYGPISVPLANHRVEPVGEGPSIEVGSSLEVSPSKTKVKSCPLLESFPVESIDFVLAIKCEGWPLCAQEWPSRVRMWPTQDLVQKIIKNGFHIVCKSSPEGNFRLSFSNAEVLLIENLSDLQFKTYRAFKSFVGYYKNEWSPNVKKIFCSYHLKTIVFWYCENSDPKDWNENSVVRHLLSLIDKLIAALKQRSLPMYFMPKYNLMEKMEDGREVAEKIADLRFDLALISHAIISEESDAQDWINFTSDSFLPIISQVFQGFEKGKFEVDDFLRGFESMNKVVDEFWINAFGQVPSVDDVEAKKRASTLMEAGMNFFTEMTKTLNDDYFPEDRNSQKEDKENEKKKDEFPCTE